MERMTTKEAAEFLGIHAQTLHADRSTRRGSLGVPFYRVGKKVHYRKADLLAWLDQQQEIPRPVEAD